MSSKSKKSRPVSTAAISVPQVHNSSALTALSYFSPNTDLFALLLLAVDKHRLRVFDTTTASVLVEHTVDDARVTALSWALLDFSADTAPLSQSRTKKRKKTIERVSETPQALAQIVVLGLSNGSLLLFSPTHARVLRTLSHPSSLAPVLATSIGTQPYYLWSSSEDGTVRLWNTSRNELLGRWKNDGGIPYSALSTRPCQTLDDETELLVANHAMSVLSLPTPTSPASDLVKPDQRFSFTGHASAVLRLQWDASQPSRFISTAEGDRFVHVWHVPDAPAKEGVMMASVPLDAFARHAILSSTDTKSLLTVSASGKVALFELPLPVKTITKVATLSPRSTISAPSKKNDDEVQVVAATFIPQEHGSVRIARLQGGVRPVFEAVRYLDDSGEFIPQVSLSKVPTALASSEYEGPNTSQKRYTEAPSLAVRSGLELGQDAMMDNVPFKGIDGDLDVDLSELSLGQRLTALTGGADVAMGDGSSADDAGSPAKTSRRRKKPRGGKEVDTDHFSAPTHSLSRTLVQALHSGDTRLLETCLIHSDEGLVLNTVRRLPPQLAVPLLNACVERLGRGARGGTGKGGGGGASAQRGTGLLRWVRAVLIVHTAHLATIPDVVARLSGLHATLTARLALRDPILSLSGRLDLVLSQIEIRSSIGPALSAADGKATGKKSDKRGPVKYVEGESESEDGEEDDIQVDKDHDSGSVEDVELGGASGSDGEDEGESLGGEDEDGNSEEDEMHGGPRPNGFIDDEAEEWSTDDGDSDE